MASQSQPQQTRNFGVFRNQNSDGDLSERSDSRGYHVSDSYDSGAEVVHTFPPGISPNHKLQGLDAGLKESEGDLLAEGGMSASVAKPLNMLMKY